MILCVLVGWKMHEKNRQKTQTFMLVNANKDHGLKTMKMIELIMLQFFRIRSHGLC